MIRRLPAVILLAVASIPMPAAPRSTEPKAAPATAPAGVRLTVATVTALKARSIGPAIMGGRVSDIAIDPNDPFTFYVGLGTGGIMKTTNSGGSFSAIFEHEAVAAIGALAVSPADSKVVWAGTGEANDRNSSAWGNGVYRSTDGGATWTNTGLGSSRTVARIVAHPADAGTAWVAAMGDLWNPGGDRGLFATTDGGKTWKALLQAPAPYADRVGCGDVAIDPSNPSVIYATLYARRRTPWSFTAGPAATDGKDLGGIFKSTDGGAHWSRLEGGLPPESGRIGLAVSPKDPRIVYAIVQSLAGEDGAWNDRSRRGGIFRSEDAGATWTRMNDRNPRPFYFSQIRVDPVNPQRIYLLGYLMHYSDDGGKTLREDRFAKVHPDCHALAIDPKRPARLLLGTDGGVYESFEEGKSWLHLANHAAGEFYRIAVDGGDPYRICGGLQDNSNWVGPSRTMTKDGILNSDWIQISGGDGFACGFDLSNPDVVYAESQEGDFYRFDMASGALKQLKPAPREGQTRFRFHWASPLLVSAHTKDTVYLGGNRVFRINARGEDWRPISPDLSAQDPLKTQTSGSGAESYGVVYALTESPMAAGLLWAGTDDGKLWRTEDDGGAWTDLTANLPALVKAEWISRIEASHHDRQRAYVVVDAHRSGNFAPFILRTDDAGKSWKSVAGDLPMDHPVKVVRESPANPAVLFAGTEFGLFATADGGAHWTKLPGVPTVAVDDLVIAKQAHDLVVATHGRSLYIVDDIGPLEALTPEAAASTVTLFPPRPVKVRDPLPGWGDWWGVGTFRGANPPDGAVLTLWMKEDSGEDASIEIADAAGVTVAKLTVPGRAGLQRVTWDLRQSKDLRNDYGGDGDRYVAGGTYTVTATKGKAKSVQPLTLTVAQGIETR